ncbi:hypothetical protein [Joostella sp. CR20]|uniref:hypothetical protein n=1 Tax=Joostella sp. CR20 TaxID=2804312 RepID=UPI00313B02BF
MAQKPKKCITHKKALKLQEKYAKTIEKTLKKEYGKDFASQFWWSVEELEEYIAYFKQEAKDKGYTDLGLRFSLGKYEDDDKDGNLSGFIMPTGVKTTKALADDPEMIEDVDSYNDSMTGWPPA